MKAEIKYLYKCCEKDGFKMEFDNIKDAQDAIEKDYKELHELAKELGEPNKVSVWSEMRLGVFFEANISALIDGKYMSYSLRTIVTEL